MKQGISITFLLLALVILVSCKNKPHETSLPFKLEMPIIIPPEKPVDSMLTKEAMALWLNLKNLRGRGILFGQQDATLSGVNWKCEKDSCDIKRLTGSFPALYGYEISGIGNEANMDSVPFNLIRYQIIEAFKRGGVNTITWHMNNPVTGGNAWDLTPAVGEILPDSSLEGYFKDELRKIAGFFKQLRNENGVLVPVIFRPFHESNGNWFWWGKGRCTPEDYTRLWHFTVSFLRDSMNVHNVIYAYSTDMFESKEQYMERYPGDLWVDILGTDNYWDFQWGSSISNGIAQLRMLVELSDEHKKLAALTECGFNGIPVKNWWTQFLLKSIKEDSVARNISYMMVWRNTNLKQYYTPFPGQRSALDFIAFEKDTFSLFEKDLPPLYRPF